MFPIRRDCIEFERHAVWLVQGTAVGDILQNFWLAESKGFVVWLVHRTASYIPFAANVVKCTGFSSSDNFASSLLEWFLRECRQEGD